MDIKLLKKLNKTILSILLLSITYSFSYAITYNLVYEEECTTVSEFIAEKTQVINHDDLCDTQKQFHQCFVFDIKCNTNTYELLSFQKNEILNLYIFKLSTSLLKPPTA